jgi:hypothetical protein
MENQDHDFWMKVSDKVPTDFSSVFDARGLGCLNKYRLADCWLTRRSLLYSQGMKAAAISLVLCTTSSRCGRTRTRK